MSLTDELREIEREGREAIAAAATREDLDRVRVGTLGRKGRLTLLLRRIGELPEEVRREAGREGNRIKEALTRLFEERAAALEGAGRAAVPEEDLTLPGRLPWRGGRHPCTLVLDEIVDIFRGLGFVRAAGPEVETLWYNFTALNTSLDHPAADAQATLYVAPEVVLRTHTSPVQVRVMQSSPPPIRVVVPGMVYRRDPWDASHAPAFEQLEGLAVDEGISLVDLKATIRHFVHAFFGRETRYRFRPAFFPFTEPSAEVDISCTICGGSGCAACKRTGWMEIMGSGVVDPAVFEAVGYDPERYTGFAFGMGITRITLLRYEIPDIRLLYDGDMRFLEQFA